MVKQTSGKLFGMAKNFCLLTSFKILKLLMACNLYLVDNILTYLDKRMRNNFFNKWVQVPVTGHFAFLKRPLSQLMRPGANP